MTMFQKVRMRKCLRISTSKGTQDKPLIHFLVEHFQRKTHQQLDDLKSKHFKEDCLSFSKSKHIFEREKHYQI